MRAGQRRLLRISCAAMDRGRLGVIVAVVLAAIGLLSGCGSSSTPAAPANATSSELSYFPAQSPLVLTIQTDPNSPAIKQVKGLLSKFPTVGVLESALIGRLQQAGINYQNDVRPLLGNPLAFGDISPSISSFGQNYLVAWVT